jgi:hypothetical protein
MMTRTMMMMMTLLMALASGACGGEAPAPPDARQEGEPAAPVAGERACQLPAACEVRASCAWCGLPGDRGAALRREGACWVTDHTTTAEGAAEWWGWCPVLTGDAPPPAP